MTRYFVILVATLLGGCASSTTGQMPVPAATPVHAHNLAGPPSSTCDVNSLQGRLLTDSLSSETLGSKRAVTVYVPPPQSDDHRWPVVFAADGEDTPRLACSLEASARSGQAPLVVIVGVHSSRSPATAGFGTSGRSREYVYSLDDAAYAAHEAFFTETVIPWAESRFPISHERAKQAVFGMSNGASFATVVSRRHPSLFGSVIAFSHALERLGSAAGTDLTDTRFYLMYGDQEVYVDENTEAVANAVRSSGGTATVATWSGGHDFAVWMAEFPAAVAWFVESGSD